MKSRIVTMALALLSVSAAVGQEQLSLKDCVRRATEKNINVSQAMLEQSKSEYKKNETRSSLLPQVEISGTFQDNLQLPVTMIDASALGVGSGYLEAKMGMQYSTSAGIVVNQVLYNQTALTALKLSKKGEYTATLGVEKAKEEIAKEVSKLYFLAQTTAEQKQLVTDNIDRTQRMTDIVKRLVDNGVSKQVDYDRIMVNLQNLQTQQSNTEALYERQVNMIKYMLEMPLDKEIVLTDSASMPLLLSNPTAMNDFSGHIDIQMLDAQKDMAELSQKVVNHGYIPSLVFYGQYGYTGSRPEFGDYFNDSPLNKWFPSSYVGLKLSIPVFDGLQKQSKSNQAKVDYQKASLNLDNTKERFSVNYKNAMNNYFNSKTNVDRQKQNIDLAQKVYDETALRYREGMSGMSDLLQDKMGLSNAQASYLNALYNFKEAELEIMSLNGGMERLANGGKPRKEVYPTPWEE